VSLARTPFGNGVRQRVSFGPPIEHSAPPLLWRIWRDLPHKSLGFGLITLSKPESF
jgi:hypothetical protein